MTNIAIANDRLEWIFPSNMVIFHSYVKLLEGNLPSSKHMFDPKKTPENLHEKDNQMIDL